MGNCHTTGKVAVKHRRRVQKAAYSKVPRIFAVVFDRWQSTPFIRTFANVEVTTGSVPPWAATYRPHTKYSSARESIVAQY